MTIAIVSSVIANKYWNGGNAWVVLSWIRGLQRLGLDVYLIEQIAPATCVDEAGQITSFQESVNRSYFREITEQFGLSEYAALIYDNGVQTDGLALSMLKELAGDADLLINITGHLMLEPLKGRPRKKVYLDLDPGFTQFWHAEGNDRARLGGHDFYFTIGENIGKAECSIPRGELEWHTIRQPVILDDWNMVKNNAGMRFTTIATWRGPYGAVTLDGKTFGQKVHEFRQVIDLPMRTGHCFELALDIHPTEVNDLALLHARGWQVVDAKQLVSTPNSFRGYVQSSSAEFSVAQGIYVETNSGWFSDRTVRYLASGKPALVQETGLSRNYPVGAGLLTFRTLDEAVNGAEAIVRDYEQHARAARALAEEYFDSDRVLANLLEQVGVTA